MKQDGASDPTDLAAQLAAMQRLMAEQAAQLRAQQAILEKEREERQKREEELLRQQQDGSSGVHSRVTNSLASSVGGDSGTMELEMLRRQLEHRERELREKEEKLKEMDDRLSLMTQRSDSNSVMSEDAFFPGGYCLKIQKGELPQLQTSVCECTERGFPRCILYKRDICTCSFSCSFVKEYFKPPKGCSFFLT